MQMVSHDGHAGPNPRPVKQPKDRSGNQGGILQPDTDGIHLWKSDSEDGATVSMHSEKIKELDPPTPTYVEDPTLEPV